MDDYVDQTMLELERYAIGQPVPRSEDPVLLLVDALGEYGIRHIDMPATPERVWRAIGEARGTSSR